MIIDTYASVRVPPPSSRFDPATPDREPTVHTAASWAPVNGVRIPCDGDEFTAYAVPGAPTVGG